MLQHCYSSDTRLIPAGHQPALVVEFARRRELDLPSVLHQSELSEAELGAERCEVRPAQWLRLLGNLNRALDARDTSFLLGQQMFPGHYGHASLALSQACHLEQALRILIAQQAELCPLLAPRLRLEADKLIVYWQDSCGAGSLLPFLVEMHMTALSALCRWQSGERLPWRYYFNRTRPRYIEQHTVHLGPQLHFGSQFDAMVLDSDWLHRAWPRGNETGVRLSLRQLGGDRPKQSLLVALYDYLQTQIRSNPTLEVCAKAFATSPATLKRRLALDGSHFQAVLDLVRTHESLFLMQFQGYDEVALAAHLGFHDARNFRRSFERWTGGRSDSGYELK